MHLVVFGELPDAARLAEVEEYLWEAGRLPPEFAASLRQLARHGAHPMATLQADHAAARARTAGGRARPHA